MHLRHPNIFLRQPAWHSAINLQAKKLSLLLCSSKYCKVYSQIFSANRYSKLYRKHYHSGGGNILFSKSNKTLMLTKCSSDRTWKTMVSVSPFNITKCFHTPIKIFTNAMFNQASSFHNRSLNVKYNYINQFISEFHNLILNIIYSHILVWEANFLRG